MRLLRRNLSTEGRYFLKPGEIEKVRKTILINGALNAKIVDSLHIPLQSWLVWKFPEDTKIPIGEVESVDISEEFAHEAFSGILQCRGKNFDVR